MIRHLRLVTSADERTARVEAESEQQPRPTTGVRHLAPAVPYREERIQEASRVLRSGDDFDPPEAA